MEEVSFDPGFSKCMLGVSDNVEFMYSAFVSSIGNLKQKKFQFSILFPKIQSMLKTNVGFYLGCLLWASYLKNSKTALILDNPCLNEEYNEDTAVDNVNYLIDFVCEKLNKDAKYYLNKTYTTDERYIKILNIYKDFVLLNKGFTQTKKTDEIILPENLKKLNEASLSEVENIINNTLEKKDLNILYEAYDFILD